MWRLKQFMPNKEAGGTLEGKHVDVGDLKLQVRSVIAQGGFSSVYLAKESSTGKTYALKHIICNDAESVELVKKEVAVMKALRGHPNVVTLHGQVVYDCGRTKECFLVMEYCHKMLANVLENRGAGYYDEKQILVIFLDICNAVYAMHSQSPSIAHRDLKVENVLLGADGSWKVCDFGSNSTNHKHFDSPEEMGLEEDCIRKFTTPSYRAPEMWDLYQKELISEKVDVWALGCLLYRIAYLKSAFDGESKLQILNCNYRIPESPRYSSAITGLIKDMLNVSPEARPSVMQVWQRVNEALPPDCRRSHPDKAPVHNKPLTASQKHHNTGASAEGARVPSSTSSVASRTPPKESEKHSMEPVGTSNNSAKGAFWSTQYAEAAIPADSNSRQEKGTNSKSSLPVKSTSPPRPSRYLNTSPPKVASSPPLRSGGVAMARQTQGSAQNTRYRDFGNGEVEQGSGWQSEEEAGRSSSTSRQKHGGSEERASTDDSSFAAFEVEYTQSAVHSRTQDQLKDEVDRLNAALKQALEEKSVIASKYEKLTVICRSQRQEIQDLKVQLGSGAEKNPSPTHPHSSSRAKKLQSFEQGSETQGGTIWDLQEGLTTNSTNQQSSWAAFEDPPNQVNSTRPPQGNLRASTDSLFNSSGKIPDRGIRQHDMRASTNSLFGLSEKTPERSVRQQEVRASNPGGESRSKAQERSPTVGSTFNNAKVEPPKNRMNQPAGWAGF